MAASVTGRAHASRGLGNEDSLRTDCLPNGTQLLALADGAGSANRAAEGASLAVETAIVALRQSLGRETARTAVSAHAGVQAEVQQDAPATPMNDDDRGELTDALQAALTAVRQAVAARVRESRVEVPTRPREFSSTLLLAVLRGDKLAVLQLGDGAIVAGGPDGWRRVTQPLRGDHAGETVFATSRGATKLARIDVISLAPGEALALLSDGLEPVATDIATGEPHPPFFEPLLTFVRSDRPLEQLEADLEEFLGSERVQSRSSDDLSLIVAVRQLE